MASTLFCFRQLLSADQPTDQIVGADPQPDEQQRDYEDDRSDSKLELAVSILVGRGKLVLRKIRRRSVHSINLTAPKPERKKEKSRRTRDLSPLRRLDVCLICWKAEREALTKSRLDGHHCSSFFATPTRLAVGLGTKDYPRAVRKLFAPVSRFRSTLVPPRRFTMKRLR